MMAPSQDEAESMRSTSAAGTMDEGFDAGGVAMDESEKSLSVQIRGTDEIATASAPPALQVT